MLTRAMILRAAILSVVAYAIGLPVSDSLNALEKSAQSHCSPNCGTKCESRQKFWEEGVGKKLNAGSFRQQSKQDAYSKQHGDNDAAHVLDLELIGNAASSFCKKQPGQSCSWQTLETLADMANFGDCNFLPKSATANRGWDSKNKNYGKDGKLTGSARLQAESKSGAEYDSFMRKELGGGCGAMTCEGVSGCAFDPKTGTSVGTNHPRPMYYHAQSDRCQQAIIDLIAKPETQGRVDFTKPYVIDSLATRVDQMFTAVACLREFAPCLSGILDDYSTRLLEPADKAGQAAAEKQGKKWKVDRNEAEIKGTKEAQDAKAATAAPKTEVEKREKESPEKARKPATAVDTPPKQSLANPSKSIATPSKLPGATTPSTVSPKRLSNLAKGGLMAVGLVAADYVATKTFGVSLDPVGDAVDDAVDTALDPATKPVSNAVGGAVQEAATGLLGNETAKIAGNTAADAADAGLKGTFLAALWEGLMLMIYGGATYTWASICAAFVWLLGTFLMIAGLVIALVIVAALLHFLGAGDLVDAVGHVFHQVGELCHLV